jgi:hypothetical protein
MQRVERDLPHSLLVTDLHAIMRDGLNAKVNHPKSSTARGVCRYLLDIAYKNAFPEERSYLPIIKKRIDGGNLSEKIAEHIRRRSQRTDLKEAILNIYSQLAVKLKRNEIYV